MIDLSKLIMWLLLILAYTSNASAQMTTLPVNWTDDEACNMIRMSNSVQKLTALNILQERYRTEDELVIHGKVPPQEPYPEHTLPSVTTISTVFDAATSSPDSQVRAAATHCLGAFLARTNITDLFNPLLSGPVLIVRLRAATAILNHSPTTAPLRRSASATWAAALNTTNSIADLQLAISQVPQLGGRATNFTAGLRTLERHPNKDIRRTAHQTLKMLSSITNPSSSNAD